MRYFLRSLNSKDFEIELDGQPMFTAKFPDWYNFNAVAQSGDTQYSFKRNKFWKSGIAVYKDDLQIGKIAFNWKGQMKIQLVENQNLIVGLVPSNIEESNTDFENNGEPKTTYFMRSKGVFKPKYEIFEEDAVEPFAEMQSKSDWLKTNYEISVYQFNGLMPIEEFLGIMGVCARLYKARQNGAAAG